MAGSTTDITAAKLHGQLLRESEEKFFDRLFAPYSKWNGYQRNWPPGAYIDVNDSYCPDS